MGKVNPNTTGRKVNNKSNITAVNKSVPSTSAASSSRRKSKPKKKRVIKEIVRMQKSTKLCIPKLPFSRLVRSIQVMLAPQVKYWQASAILALHEATEAFLTNFFEDAYTFSKFSNRVTIQDKDMKAAWMFYSTHGFL